jgi:hypothetical protein
MAGILKNGKISKTFNPIVFNTWKDGKKRVEFRLPNGKLIARRKIAGSGMTKKKDFEQIYKKNNTFFENRTKEHLGGGRRRNFYENVYSAPKSKKPTSKPSWDFRLSNAQNNRIGAKNLKTSRPIKKPKNKLWINNDDPEYPQVKGHALYQVSGVFQGRRYCGRSFGKGIKTDGVTVDCKTSRECKDMAWNNMMGLISKNTGGLGSRDTTYGFDQITKYGITDIEEQWVYYTRPKQHYVV